MGQITESFARTMLEQCARKEHPSLTVWEAEQLARAWLRLAEEVENAATYKQERDEICVNYETVAAKLSEAHRQNAGLMAIIDKRDEALGFIPLDKGMDMQDELREVKARLAEADQANERFAIRVLGQEAYDNSPCQAHPLELVEVEIESLRSRLAEVEAEHAAFSNNVEQCEAENDALHSRLAEAEMDAARYRWLAEQECGDVFMEHRPGDKAGLDLAIDAARAADSADEVQL